MTRSIKHVQRQQRMMNFKVTVTAGAPVLTQGSFDGSIVDNGAGDHTISFNEAFARAPIVMVTSRHSAAMICNAIPVAGSVQIKTYDAAGAALDGSYDVLVLGCDVADEN